MNIVFVSGFFDSRCQTFRFYTATGNGGNLRPEASEKLKSESSVYCGGEKKCTTLPHLPVAPKYQSFVK